jgi:hypothetical protein
MIANALLLAVAVWLATLFWLMDQLKFLIPYKAVLFRNYWLPISVYGLLFFLNLVAGFFALIRKFFLKDTGRKLLHLDRQFEAGETEIPTPWTEPGAD